MTKLTFKDVAHYYVGKIKLTTPQGVANFDFYYPNDEKGQSIGCYDTPQADWKPEEVKPHLRKMHDSSDVVFKVSRLGAYCNSKLDWLFSPEAFNYLIDKGYNVFGLDESEIIVEPVK